MDRTGSRAARESNARAAAQSYAPKPNGSTITYGLIAASLTLVVTFLVGGFFGVDITSQGWPLAGLVVLAFIAGCVLRLWRQGEHSHAVVREFAKRSPPTGPGVPEPRRPERSKLLPEASDSVTFTHPFTLPGLNRSHPPGTFRVWERREPLDVSWEAFIVTKTIMLTDGSATEALDVKADELAQALRRDRDAQD